MLGCYLCCFCVGNRKYTGSLQCAVVPGHADDEDVACNIRVGFVHRDPAHFTEGTVSLQRNSMGTQHFDAEFAGCSQLLV